MTLPASGQISMSQVNTEIRKSATAQISLNDAVVRNLFGKPSGQISMSDGWGKTYFPRGRYLRWYISATRGTEYTQAAEFQILLNNSVVSISGTTVTNPGGSNPPGEEPQYLVDNNLNTKWLDFNRPSTLIFDFKSEKIFNQYRYATANDEDQRDPTSWTISVSDDAMNWTVVASVTNASITTSRFTYTQTFSAAY